MLGRVIIKDRGGVDTHLGKAKLRFMTRHKPLEGVLLPQTLPRVIRDSSEGHTVTPPHTVSRDKWRRIQCLYH